jgi:hypothetical protein
MDGDAGDASCGGADGVDADEGRGCGVHSGVLAPDLVGAVCNRTVSRIGAGLVPDAKEKRGSLSCRAIG